MKICIINGPNLNLTGKREPETYGQVGFDTFIPELQKEFTHVEIEYYQSNVEGELINKIQEAGFTYDGIILNAGAYTHTSVAIGDAVAAIKAPVIEVHMSNIYAREEFRHKSYISGAARGVVAGFGLGSYRLALLSFTGY
ncbi:MAG: type II 3-dehydroquinate dehydratase [Bacteroidales bacterium]|nr:type II 3-dehydroquinate dehydratase [Bacteroidales bacterium]